MTHTVSLWIRVNGKFAHPSYQDAPDFETVPCPKCGATERRARLLAGTG